MKTIIYLRTSTTEQNPKNQLKDCESISKWGDYELYSEEQSAWIDHKQRPEFEKVRRRIKLGNIRHIICWDWDRLYRNRKRLVEFFKFCKLYNCTIHSFRQGWLEEINKIPEPWNEIVSDLIINILGHSAEDESRKKSDRIKLTVRKKEGKPTRSSKGNIWGRKSLSKKVKEEIMEKHKMGMSIREIADSVIYWDRNRNQKFVSKSAVHKTIQENTPNY